jgi:hypothetical protein
METRTSAPHTSLRLPAWLLLGGQALYIAATQLHTGGEANNHHAIFDAYAHSRIWTAVHLGQFAAMAILLAGLLTLSLGLSERTETLGRLGAASAVAALALYGALQAVDGVALKQAVNAWVSAPEAEKAVRFASAETLRWLEWGLRSYHDVATGLTLVLVAAIVAQVARLPRAVAILMGLSGFAYLVQGWVAGTEGFTPAQSVAIVLAWVLSLVWMTWLVVISSRGQEVGEIGGDWATSGTQSQ